MHYTHKPSLGKDSNIETKSLEWSGGWGNACTVWSPGQARAFFQALSIYTGVTALQRTTMPEKAWPCVMSDSVMRFLQQINKERLLVDLMQGSLNVFFVFVQQSISDMGLSWSKITKYSQGSFILHLHICSFYRVQPEVSTRYQAKILGHQKGRDE